MLPKPLMRTILNSTQFSQKWEGCAPYPFSKMESAPTSKIHQPLQIGRRRGRRACELSVNIVSKAPFVGRLIQCFNWLSMFQSLAKLGWADRRSAWCMRVWAALTAQWLNRLHPLVSQSAERFFLAPARPFGLESLLV